MKKINFREIGYGLKFYCMNYIVPYIPFWCIRKSLYRLAGMKIGKAHILMHVHTDGWKSITIEDGVCINEFCHIDGRGGLTIKKNASLSVYTKIVSGTHDSSSPTFAYSSKPVLIENNVWTGAGSIILPGTILRSRAILAAGSVAIGKEYLSNTIYSGVPAIAVRERNLTEDYDLTNWQPWFR